MDLDKIKNELDTQDIVNILQAFFKPIPFEEKSDILIFPTICHNTSIEEASMKLYYYDNTKLFHCYTECQSSFDIYELVKKILHNRGLNDDFYNVISIIQNNSKVNVFLTDADQCYTSILEKYKKNKTEIELPEYDPKVLNCFSTYKPIEWLRDGLQPQSMDKYLIRYSIAKEQIIIPHLDINGVLVGIRVRNLRPEDIELGKYMPARIEGKIYSHPLSCNLYGLYYNRAAIEETKTAWLFEGEKSVILCDGWYGNESLAVATCGNKINKIQLSLLQSLGVRNIVICYDRMNEDEQSKYFYQLFNTCRSYQNYFNFSFIYDFQHILEYKAAPVDYGREIFEHLMRKRVVIS